MFKDFMKKFTYVTGDIPTTEELELLKDARERTGLVIRARWILLGILAAYGIIPYLFFQDTSADLDQITAVHCVVPVVAWSFVALYNAWLHYSYKEFAKIRSLNQIQLLLDLIFVTVVVHFSGGAVSWFWTMYMVLTLEAALIMEKESDTRHGGDARLRGNPALRVPRIDSPHTDAFREQRAAAYLFLRHDQVGMGIDHQHVRRLYRGLHDGDDPIL
jgi:hypothetical protein